MIVIKFGGHAMSESSGDWMKELAARWRAGSRFVIVHGGGPAIDEQLKIEAVASDFQDGFRITTPAVMKVVESVLAGTVLRKVVRTLTNAGLPAVGITGSDGGLLQVSLRDGGKFGLVGQVDAVHPRILRTLLEADYLPVISPVSTDRHGQPLNVNADIAAGAIAGALTATEMIFMTDVPGIYRNWPDRDSLIGSISAAELKELKFEAGMIPKVSAAIHAVESGAQSARIIDGRSIEAFNCALTGSGGTWVSP